MSNPTLVDRNKMNIISTKSGIQSENLKKLTHLFLHDKYLQKIGNLSNCENLQVLYLHNNDILKITNLESLVTLKHLYLQKNKISKIERLETLKQLRKLYLGCNEISVIEGLEKLTNLEELHIEKQRLYNGEILCFDPRSVVNIAETLQILNMSHNNLMDINSLGPLKQIRTLNASYNSISNVEEAAKIVHNWFYLTELNFIGNPMTKQHRYRDTLIADTFRLVILDNKDINETTRSFIKRFEYEKYQNKLNSASKINIKPKNIPGKIPPTIESSISNSIIKSISTSVLNTNLNDESEKYVPWKALKAHADDSGKVVPPLFAKQQRRRKPQTKKVQFAMFPDIS